MIHRADYHKLLLDEALRLGGQLRKDAEVIDVNTSVETPFVTLHTGEKVHADVIVAADGRRRFHL